ncbi:MAG: alpha/beta hydrolase [Patescibacteria group bacterium]
MLLFIHGSGATNSLWIPQIRGIFSFEDQDISDRYLLDLFTISLPGHSKDDKYFEAQDVARAIELLVPEKREKQLELADKLIFSNNKEAVNALKSPKVFLIGHSIGGVVALNYTFRNLNLVEKIVLVSCAFDFDNIGINITSFFCNQLLFRVKPKYIQSFQHKTSNIRLKTLFSICLENPDRKALRSCTKICREYSFASIYKLLSLEEQLKFSKIPILGVGGYSDRLVSASSFKKLKKYLNKQDKLLSTKKTLIQEQQTTPLNNFIYKLYPTGHHPMDDQRLWFIQDVRDFLAT